MPILACGVRTSGAGNRTTIAVCLYGEAVRLPASTATITEKDARP